MKTLRLNFRDIRTPSDPSAAGPKTIPMKIVHRKPVHLFNSAATRAKVFKGLRRQTRKSP